MISGRLWRKFKKALRQCRSKLQRTCIKYIWLFKEFIDVGNAIDFRIFILDDFDKGSGRKSWHYIRRLSQPGQSFIWNTRILCEDKKLFEKIMGCSEKCPSCSTLCYQSLDKHTGDHRASHYSMGVGGTVERKGLFVTIYNDATGAKNWKPRKLALSTCQAIIGTRVDIRAKV